jgi:hypothetical protein
MDMTHVQPFLDEINAGRVDRLGEHLSEHVVVFSSMVSDPFVGRDAVVKLLGVLHSALDEFVTTAVIAGDTRGGDAAHPRRRRRGHWRRGHQHRPRRTRWGITLALGAGIPVEYRRLPTDRISVIDRQAMAAA